MPFNSPLTSSQNYVFGRGVCYFAEFDADGNPMGERDLGNVPGLTLTVTSEVAEHFSSRSGIAKKDLTTVVSVAFNAAVAIEDFSAENFALFLGGSTGTKTQASSPVTAELIPNIRGGREYQLGATISNPTGVRGVSAVVIASQEIGAASARVNSQAYTLGQIFTSGGNAYVVSTAGTTAGSPPTFNTAIAATTTDGTAVVTSLGSTSAYSSTTDYSLSAESGRFGVIAAGNLALASAAYFAVTGDYLTADVDYTPAANSRTQITSTATGSVAGQFRFIVDNAKGENRDLFISSVSLAPSGELPFITEGTDVAQATFDLGVNERDTSTPLIIIDGRPV
jgi:hypothetical protein